MRENDHNRPRQASRKRGFTLLEVAVSLTLLGLVLGGGLLVGKRYFEGDMRRENEAYLAQARQALLAFSRQNGRLPGLDTTLNGPLDGQEDYLQYTHATNVRCASQIGWLPYATLNLPPADVWGNRLKYSFCPRLGSDQTANCATLKAIMAESHPTTGAYSELTDTFSCSVHNAPRVLDMDYVPIASGTIGFAVAAVVASSGGKVYGQDSDPVNGNFDAFTYKGKAANNRTAHQYDVGTGGVYYKAPPIDGTVDDQIVYITFAELYDMLNCTPIPARGY